MATDTPPLINQPLQLMKYETLEVHRHGPTQYVDGKPIRPPVTVFSIRGNVQPLSGRELLLVPEADRFLEQYFVWTFNDVQVSDIVKRCGANYHVQNVEAWGRYNKARIMRVDVGPIRSP